jgi:23S rRNA maturation mini-RNase III
MHPLKIALNIDIRLFFNLNILKSIAFLVHINLNTLAYLGDNLSWYILRIFYFASRKNNYDLKRCCIKNWVSKKRKRNLGHF